MRGVFYVAYGSNLDLDRFRCYLLGGSPDGAGRTYPGSRDRVGWGMTFDAHTRQPLYFAGHSSTWGGGAMGFMDPHPMPDALTPVRVYLLSGVQFEDLVAQENGLEPGSVDIDLQAVSRPGLHTIGRGTYDTVLSWGRASGDWPILTITAAKRQDVGAPSVPYLQTLVRGLRQTHDMSDDELVAYLGSRPGMPPDESLVLSALR
jgi:hypothetical protein